MKKPLYAVLLMLPYFGAVGQQSDSLAKKIDRIFSEWDRTNSPGCSLAVLKDGKIIYERGYGMSNLEYNIAITPVSRFHVASISKQLTAAAIVRLSLEGKLSLNDNIRKYIPEVPDFGHTITLANLLHHTSGLRDQWDLQYLAGWREDDVITEGDILDMTHRQTALNFTPGDEYLYCNTGFTLLGIVVKRVTGVSLRNYDDSVFFKPLGMDRTVFHSDHKEIVVGRTSGYVRGDDNRWMISIPVFDNYGATSLFTTVEDLAKWDENFYRKTVGGPAFTEAMLKPGVFNDGKSQTYACGLAIGEYKGNKIVEHAGADAGYRADFLRFPDLHFSVIILANLADINPSDLCRRVADLWVPDRSGGMEPMGKADTAAARKWAGDYMSPVSKTRAELADVHGWLSRDGVGLRPLNDSVFVRPRSGDRYIFRENGGHNQFTLQSTGMEDRVFAEVKRVKVPVAALGEYMGTFYSKELDARYVLFVKDSVLMVKTPRNEAMGMRAFIRDVFVGPFTMEFLRDRKGRVTGFLVTTGRSRGIRFEREAGHD